MAELGSRWSSTLLAVMAVALPVCAAADSAAPQRYDILVSGQTVRICVVDFADRACPDSGLLRRHKSSGQVVEITTCDGLGCFQDDCVPAGEYQYGLKSPLACVPAAVYTEYFHEAAVPEPAAGTVCTSGVEPPAAYSATVPWGADQMVCTYQSKSGCGSRAGPVLTLNGLLILVGVFLWRRRAKRALLGA
jgi:hypothetical protein